MTWCKQLAAIFGRYRVAHKRGHAAEHKTEEEVSQERASSVEAAAIDRFRATYQASEKEQNSYNETSRSIAVAALVVAFFVLIATGLQALYARDVLNETIRFNETTQRAYVIVPRIDFTREKTPTDNPNVSVPALGVRVSYENGGLTPATITDSWIFTTNFSPADKAEHCPNVQNPQNIGLLVPPKVPREQRVYHASLESQLVASLADRSKSTVTFYGGLTYTDAFNKVRRTKYCFTLSPWFNSSTADDYTYDPDRVKRSAFDACNFCNSWD